MKACYKLILRFFHGYGQAFPKFSKYQVCNVFTISLKRSGRNSFWGSSRSKLLQAGLSIFDESSQTCPK